MGNKKIISTDARIRSLFVTLRHEMFTLSCLLLGSSSYQFMSELALQPIFASALKSVQEALPLFLSRRLSRFTVYWWRLNYCRITVLSKNCTAWEYNNRSVFIPHSELHIKFMKNIIFAQKLILMDGMDFFRTTSKKSWNNNNKCSFI